MKKKAPSCWSFLYLTRSKLFPLLEALLGKGADGGVVTDQLLDYIRLGQSAGITQILLNAKR